MIVVASAVSLTVPDVGPSSRFFTGALGFREELVLDGLVQLRRDDAAMDIELCAGVITATNVTMSLTVTDLLTEYHRLRRAAPAPGPVLRHEPWGERSASRGEMSTSATTVSFCCKPLRAPAPWSPRMWPAALKERL